MSVYKPDVTLLLGILRNKLIWEDLDGFKQLNTLSFGIKIPNESVLEASKEKWTSRIHLSIKGD